MKTKSFLLLLVCTLLHSFLSTNIYSQVSAIETLEGLTGVHIPHGNGPYEIPTASRPTPPDYYDEEFTKYMFEQANFENDKGIEYYNKKKWSKSIRYFKRALKYYPNNSTYKTNLDNARKNLEIEKIEKRYAKIFKKVDKKFLKAINKNIKTHDQQLDKLSEIIRKIAPKIIGETKTIHEGIILGATSTQENNPISTLNLKSPFNNRTSAYFATTDNPSGKDWVRAILDDNSTGKFTLNTKYGKELIKKLKGTHFNRLIAHSNGAMVSEALIREKVITVDELNIIGGDRAIMNFNGYNALIASGTVKRVVVWLNPADIIPLGTSFDLLMPVGPKTQYYVENFAAFYSYKLLGKAGLEVEYRVMKGPEFTRGQDAKNFNEAKDAHSLDAYFENIRKWFERPNNGSTQ